MFGFTNEELRAAFGIRVNRQLFLCYFIIYNIITKFYTDSATYTYQDYVKIHEIVENVTLSFHRVFQQIQTVVFTEVEEYSFKEIALLWEQMPDVSTEAGSGVRAEMGKPHRPGEESVQLSGGTEAVHRSGGDVLSHREV